MKLLKTLVLFSAFGLCAVTTPVFAADEKPASPEVPASGKDQWLTDYKKAAAAAKSGKRIMLLDFTGSDWCGWCIKLNKEVFDTPEFKKYAKENLILVELDFPKAKTQSKELQEQNRELAKKYGIKGYPSIIVLDSEEKQLGELGYMRGGPKAFIAELEKLKPAKK